MTTLSHLITPRTAVLSTLLVCALSSIAGCDPESAELGAEGEEQEELGGKADGVARQPESNDLEHEFVCVLRNEFGLYEFVPYWRTGADVTPIVGVRPEDGAHDAIHYFDADTGLLPYGLNRWSASWTSGNVEHVVSGLPAQEAERKCFANMENPRYVEALEGPTYEDNFGLLQTCLDGCQYHYKVAHEAFETAEDGSLAQRTTFFSDADMYCGYVPYHPENSRTGYDMALTCGR